MKFDHDIARKFLLAIESSDSLEGISVAKQNEFAEAVDVDDNQLSYIILLLNEAGFITNKPVFGGEGFYSYFPTQLTYVGHEYLDTVRSPEVWKKSKAIATKIGNVSLKLMGDIATNVITSMLGLK